jgi:hypothetical protein
LILYRCYRKWYKNKRTQKKKKKSSTIKDSIEEPNNFIQEEVNEISEQNDKIDKILVNEEKNEIEINDYLEILKKMCKKPRISKRKQTPIQSIKKINNLEEWNKFNSIFDISKNLNEERIINEMLEKNKN